MGKGDKKTKRGKLWRGSYGKNRNKKTNVAHPPVKVEKRKRSNQLPDIA